MRGDKRTVELKSRRQERGGAGALGVPVSELLVGGGSDVAAAPFQSCPARERLGGHANPDAGAGSGRTPGGRTRELAEEILRDPARAAGLAVAARGKLESSESWRLGEVRADLRTLIDLLAAYASGTYRVVSWEALVFVAAGLQYYLDAGYFDDAAVLVFVTEMVAPELDRLTPGRHVARHDGEDCVVRNIDGSRSSSSSTTTARASRSTR